MAENYYFIFVDNQPSPDMKELLPKLDLDKYEPEEEVDIQETNKPDTLFVGHYNNCLIFAHPDLPFHFFGKNTSETEKRFIACFPNSEIATLIQNTTVNLFGFSVIENGQKIRMKDGADDKYYNDFGGLLPEEEENQMQDQMDEEEIESLREDGMEEEELDLFLR